MLKALQIHYISVLFLKSIQNSQDNETSRILTSKMNHLHICKNFTVIRNMDSGQLTIINTHKPETDYDIVMTYIDRF